MATTKEIAERLDEISSMIEEGMTINAIACHFGVTWKTMKRVFSSLGLQAPTVQKKQESKPKTFDFSGMRDIDVAAHDDRMQASKELARRGYTWDALDKLIRNKEMAHVFNGKTIVVSVATGAVQLRPYELAAILDVDYDGKKKCFASRSELSGITRSANKKKLADFRLWMDSEVIPKMMPKKDINLAGLLACVPGGVKTAGFKACSSSSVCDGLTKTRYWLSPVSVGKKRITVRKRMDGDTESVM